MASEPRFDPFTGQALTGEHAAPPALKHSGPGIASFIMGLLFGLILFVLICLAGVLHARTPDGLKHSPQAIAIGLGIIASFMATLGGLVLGIVGVALPNRQKGRAIAGLVLNACIVVGVAGLLAIGLAARWTRPV